jgi:hypothetical protein
MHENVAFRVRVLTIKIDIASMRIFSSPRGAVLLLPTVVCHSYCHHYRLRIANRRAKKSMTEYSIVIANRVLKVSGF